MQFSSFHTHRTGEINFFSACMAIGIAPDRIEPAEVIQNDDGTDYLSFRLNAVSECGMHLTLEMNKAWDYPAAFQAEKPNHPFAMLMRFTKHSKGARRKDDWIESIASFLGIARDSVRKAIRDVDTLTGTAPESDLTYLACFVVNRFAAIRWAKDAIPKTAISKGKSIVMVDGTMSKRRQDEFLKMI